jgi:hypothetical protein
MRDRMETLSTFVSSGSFYHATTIVNGAQAKSGYSG